MKLVAIALVACTAAALMLCALLFRFDVVPLSDGSGPGGAYLFDRWTHRVEIMKGPYRLGVVADYPGGPLFGPKPSPAWQQAPEARSPDSQALPDGPPPK